MQVQINFGDIDSSEALSDHVQQHVEKALEHVARQITRVEVHLHDDKQKGHAADDKRCTMEGRIASHQPIAVEARGDDIYKAVGECATKLGRAVSHKLERLHR